jgi:serpin B
MRRALALPHLLSLLVATRAASGTEPKLDTGPLVKGNTAFALELYRRLGEDPEHAGKNLFFSPYSLSSALAMTLAGARGNTATEMASVLHAGGDQLHEVHARFSALAIALREGRAPGPELHVANSLWGQKETNFLAPFLETVRSYGGHLGRVDFERATEDARKTLNSWVERATRDRIPELIAPGQVNADTRLVLTNAIYFKSAWQTAFEKKRTQPGTFTLLDGTSKKINFMHRKADSASVSYRNLPEDEFKMLSLPYAGNELSLVIFLPRKAAGLTTLRKSLTSENLERWLSGTWKTSPKVEVALPTLTMTSGFELSGALKAMGMKDAFDRERSNFSGMTDLEGGFVVDKVLHKASIDMNEEGTVATAATVVRMDFGSEREEDEGFSADHPFIFLIRDQKTGTVLFVGQVADPQGVE